MNLYQSSLQLKYFLYTSNYFVSPFANLAYIDHEILLTSSQTAQHLFFVWNFFLHCKADRNLSFLACSCFGRATLSIARDIHRTIYLFYARIFLINIENQKNYFDFINPINFVFFLCCIVFFALIIVNNQYKQKWKEKHNFFWLGHRAFNKNQK